MNKKNVLNKIHGGGVFSYLNIPSFSIPFFGVDWQSCESLCLFCALNGGNINE